MPLIPGLGRQRWADLIELKASLVYTESSRTDQGCYTEETLSPKQNNNNNNNKTTKKKENKMPTFSAFL